MPTMNKFCSRLGKLLIQAKRLTRKIKRIFFPLYNKLSSEIIYHAKKKD